MEFDVIRDPFDDDVHIVIKPMLFLNVDPVYLIDISDEGVLNLDGHIDNYPDIELTDRSQLKIIGVDAV